MPEFTPTHPQKLNSAVEGQALANSCPHPITVGDVFWGAKIYDHLISFLNPFIPYCYKEGILCVQQIHVYGDLQHCHFPLHLTLCSEHREVKVHAKVHPHARSMRRQGQSSTSHLYPQICKQGPKIIPRTALQQAHRSQQCWLSGYRWNYSKAHQTKKLWSIPDNPSHSTSNPAPKLRKGGTNTLVLNLHPARNSKHTSQLPSEKNWN